MDKLSHSAIYCVLIDISHVFQNISNISGYVNFMSNGLNKVQEYILYKISWFPSNFFDF